jgi:hypothetical protein
MNNKNNLRSENVEPLGNARNFGHEENKIRFSNIKNINRY